MRTYSEFALLINETVHRRTLLKSVVFTSEFLIYNSKLEDRATVLFRAKSRVK